MKRTPLLLLCLFFVIHLSAQKQNSLLWRISGNGLTKHSYLFGTMHLQDKRLFNFSDSLYYYLEQSEGYAMELDMKQFMDTLMRKMLDQAGDDYITQSVSKKMNNRKWIDSLVRNVKINKDKSSARMLKKIRDEKMQRALKNKEMPTFVDAYLFGIAQKHNKWLGGIEDVEDQLYILDELGRGVSSEELLAPDKETTTSLERMIGLYVAQDLPGIEEFCNRYSDIEEMLMLNKRNVKMARRMDSLSHIRSTFFAVGAAHLSGDSGVIRLLRERGFSVEPVFSRHTIDPVAYVSKLENLQWTKMKAADGSYEVDMPGQATESDVFGDQVKMKVCLDITTMTFYLSGSFYGGRAIDTEPLMTKYIEGGSAGRLIKRKTIERDGIKGSEGMFFKDEYYFKVQYLAKEEYVYMLIAGAEKKELVEKGDVTRFLESFRATPVKKPAASWTSFDVEEKAIRVEFPGTPRRNKSLEDVDEGTIWNFTAYDLMDNFGNYYLLQIRDLKSGYYIDGDSAQFSGITQGFTNLIDTMYEQQRTSIQMFPAYRMKAGKTDQQMSMSMLTVNRSGRVYLLYAGGPQGAEAEAAVAHFINSIKLTEYKEAEAKKFNMAEGGFTIDAWSAPNIALVDSTQPEIYRRVYTFHHEQEAVSYMVFHEVLNEYYWAGNDSIFFNDQMSRFLEIGDSVIAKRPVQNGNLKGMEWEIFISGNHTIKKLRIVANADSLYSLLAYIPAQDAARKESRRFFESFTITKEDTSRIYLESKSALLLKALRSTDSTTYTNAKAAFEAAAFSDDDRTLLHEALLLDYPGDSDDTYWSARRRIVAALEKLSDSSTVGFVRSNYAAQTGEKEVIKYAMLDVLARYKTQLSYSLLKELLIKSPPQKKAVYELSGYIIDSLELALTLYPEILTLTSDTVLVSQLVYFSNRLLDSGRISVEMLKPYHANFIKIGERELAAAMREEESSYNNDLIQIMRLIRHFNDEPANALIRKMGGGNNHYRKMAALVCLLKNGQSVDPNDVRKLAADKSYRRDLHHQLTELDKLSLFPPAYLNQRSMAESDMYLVAYDEDEPKSVTLAGERIRMHKGVKKRFFLYKIVYEYENDEGKIETYEYLGVAGPYSMDARNLKMDNDYTSIFFEEEFDLKKLDRQLDTLLKEMEENVD